MDLIRIICIVGFVTILYFICRPKTENKQKDKLTREVRFKGLPPQSPWNPWQV